EVKLEVLDQAGSVVRSYSSKDQPFRPPNPPAFPMFWIRPAEPLSMSAGMHRFVWDIRYSAPPVAQPGYSMSTPAGTDTTREPEGPQALPGSYKVRLTVDGMMYVQPFKLVMDPRVKTSPADLQKKFELEARLVQALRQANEAVNEIHAASQAGRITPDQEKQLAGVRPRRGEATTDGGPNQPAFAQISGNLGQLIVAVDTADAAPTAQASQAAEKTLAEVQALLKQWESLKSK